MKKIAFIFLLFTVFESFGQPRTCASSENLAEELQLNPEMQQRLNEQELYTRQYQSAQRSLSEVITIPVVFHIIHDGDAVGTDENVSDALIMAQLDQMNDDFALLNSDVGMIPAMFQSDAANTKIQFCLAVRTPDCQPTNGIDRINGGQASWTRNQINSTLKPSTIWDRNQYLNVWTVRFGGSDDGLLGYAQFPGGTASTDGVVNAFYTTGSLATPNPHPDGFGVYNKGRTMTHELGHWLNLRHIWGDANCGDDLVADTPTHQTDNGGCPSHPKTNNCNGTITEMFMNYMDYVNDDCMQMFSNGQSDRMCAVLDGGLRASLANSEGCIPLGLCYCPAAADDLAANEKISNVSFAGINQSSTSNSGYENYWKVEGTVEQEQTYNFAATISNAYSTDQILVWIDFNQNGDFEDTGELVFSSAIGFGPHSASITIPASASLGETRMRVRLHDTNLGPNTAACGSSDYGQVEDYTLNITAALPVEWLSFTAQATKDQDVALAWSTASETNNKGFEVEIASAEENSFSTLGFVPANNAGQYRFEIENLQPAQYYFRLRQIDYDGRLEFSPIRTLKLSKEASFVSLSPNPVKDELRVDVFSPQTTNTTVEVVTQTGQVLKSTRLPAGATGFEIQVGDLPKGVYLLRVTTAGNQEYVRFVVQ